MNSDSMEAARRYNEWMARRVAKWRLTRFAVMVGFAAAGSLVWMFTRQFLLAFPLFGMAAAAFFFVLIAHDHLREIRGRRWKRLTPCIVPEAPPRNAAASVAKT